MTLSKIEQYYNKFNEDKRLLSRHGQVEFETTTKYVLNILNNNKQAKIIDIGAGTGRYSHFFYEKGFNVNAVELVKHNLSRLKQNYPQIKAIQGNALNLKKFEDNSFDVALLFGPMYHLFSNEDKIKVLNEAKRVVKPSGYIFVAYLLNDYSIISYAFKENKIKEVLKNGKLTKNFVCNTSEEDLYSYETLSNIEVINNNCELVRDFIFSPDGPTDYMRQVVNKMDDETFEIYKQYVFSISKRQDLLGASSHIVDVLKVVK